jgi:hypothetical protein
VIHHASSQANVHSVGNSIINQSFGDGLYLATQCQQPVTAIDKKTPVYVYGNFGDGLLLDFPRYLLDESKHISEHMWHQNLSLV